MTPTINLRFTIKGVPAPEYGPGVARNEKVLQQYWSQTPTTEQVIAMSKGQAIDLGGEWRDVPTAT